MALLESRDLTTEYTNNTRRLNKLHVPRFWRLLQLVGVPLDRVESDMPTRRAFRCSDGG
jgi:hypothetical protein